MKEGRKEGRKERRKEGNKGERKEGRKEESECAFHLICNQYVTLIVPRRTR